MDIRERNYAIYQTAFDYLCKHAQGMTDDILTEYFYNPKKNNLDEAFGVVVSSAVDWHKPKARRIAYWDKSRSQIIEELVGNHSISYVQNTFKNDPNSLYSAFKDKLSLDNSQFTTDVWLSYANCICGMAQYLSKFNNAEEMYAYFDTFKTSKDKIKLINEIARQSHIIKTKHGWGFALTANWLKDIGMQDYCKPDIQVTNCLNSLELCSRTDTVVFKTLAAIAEDAKEYDKTASAFKLDRILWLIGSHEFYNHPEIVWDGSIEEFVSELKPKIKKK